MTGRATTLSDERPDGPEGEQPGEERPDEDRGLLEGLPGGMRWVPVLVFVVLVVAFETLAPNVYGGEEGALGAWGYVGGVTVLVVAFVVVVGLLKRHRD